MKTIYLQRAAVALGVAILTACGGGGSDAVNPDTTEKATASASATGIWTGSTDTKRDLVGVVLGDGTYYVLYGSAITPDAIAGVLQGSGTVNGSAFSSSNAKDFNLEGQGILPATLAATVVPKQSLNGTVSYANSKTTFAATYEPDSATPASVATLQGTFTGDVATSAGVEPATVTVSATGTLSGSGASGCQVGGTVKARTDVNAFDLSLTFGPAPCLFANQTFTGVAVFDPADKFMYGAAPNAARTDGILFVGSKP